jgi:hypothetical protein
MPARWTSFLASTLTVALIATMPSLYAKRTTFGFIDWLSYLPFFIALGMLGAVTVGYLISQIVLVRNLRVDPDTSVAIPPLRLVPQPIGATRITASAELGNNQWVAYEIQIKDQQGKMIASAIKQGWKESGTWYEDGESGSWAETDTQGVIDFRGISSETIIIAVDVLDYTDTAGAALEQPVPIKLVIETGVVDDRYLWAGAVGTAFFAALTLISVPHSGKKVLAKSIPDSEISDRITCGGVDQLLRVQIKVAADSTAPDFVHARLIINDDQGEKLCDERHRINLGKLKNDNGKVRSANGSLTCFFVLNPRGSYGFYLEITPDASIDRTTLTLREGSRSLFPIPVTFLKSTSGS